MLSAFSVVLLGFVLGMRHATDADHVVAVTAIVSRQPALGRASAIGALWGVGHTATILLFGGAILVFRLTIPPRLGLALEFAVAMMLVLLGIRNLAGRGFTRLESAMRPLFVGFVHGLAGTAFVAMLVLAAIPSPVLGMIYLALFGLGTIVGMMLITVAIATPAVLAARRFVRLQTCVRVAAGVASIVLGLVLAHQVAVVDGLFAASPTWTPK